MEINLSPLDVLCHLSIIDIIIIIVYIYTCIMYHVYIYIYVIIYALYLLYIYVYVICVICKQYCSNMFCNLTDMDIILRQESDVVLPAALASMALILQ
jgi:hypothetical protein